VPVPSKPPSATTAPAAATAPRCAARCLSHPPAGLLLFPGAGSGRDHPSLLAIDEAVSARAICVERVDFPYRAAGRRAPDRAEVLVDHVARSAHALADRLGVDVSRLALGGRSMGGRICSMAVAGGLPASALVLVSYPLHPPGRPDRPRTSHLGLLGLPCLFCSGTRDAFGTVDELRRAAELPAGPVDVVFVQGADHSLRRHDAEVAGIVADWLTALHSS
jgi:predicted alpha/beta-hydrolase family hydrolase